MSDTPAQLKVARKTSGLAYAVFARAIGISKSSLARYERGELPVPLTVSLAIIGLQTIRAKQPTAILSA
jgi:DNA-binding transcriptional regulator YiaG